MTTNTRLILLGFLNILLVATMGASCLWETEEHPGGDIEQAAVSLQILSHEMATDQYGGLIITGKVKNISGRELKSSEIRVEWRDSEDSNIYTSIERFYSVPAETERDFEVSLPLSDTSTIASYNILVGTGY